MAESHIEKAFRTMMREELKKLNEHLPKMRKTLKTLLQEQSPSVDSLDGRSIVLKRDELERLAEIVPPRLHDRLQLPIVVQRRFDLGRAVYTVCGGRLEEFTLKYLLGLAEHTFDDYESEAGFYIYKPYLAELIRMIHSLIVVGFGTPEGLDLGFR
ncbi:DUF61 family protein [Candidatus Bathyarchaeota archaeon]|nr:DUF61 family protein [Candidatus Bathyarchaeota archaeon]